MNKLLVFIVLISSMPVLADSVSVGYLSLLSDTPDPGLQELTINNLTGEANCQAYGLPYAACSNLDFTNWTLTVDYLSDYYSPGTGSFVYADGAGYSDIGPGSASVFDFDLCANQPGCADANDPDTQITSIEFSGQISPSSFCLYDVSVAGCDAVPESFFANPNFTLIWNAGSVTGGPYVDEGDFPYAQSPDISVADRGSASSPEPGTFFLLTVLLPFALYALRRKGKLAARSVLSLLARCPMIATLIGLAAIAGAASAQVALTTPAGAELVGANISMPGTGYPTGPISASSISITVTPSAGKGSPVSFAPTTVAGSGSIRTVVFKLPATLSSFQPYAATVCLTGQTTANVSFTTATCAGITINPAASISNVSPGAGQAGTAVNVTIAGLYSHFGPVTSVVSVSGQGVAVSNVAVPGGSTTQLTATFTIASNAALGVRAVTVTTGSEVATLASGFVVTSGPSLLLSVVNPNWAAQGTSLSVDVQGVNTHFAQGVTAANFGNAVAVTFVTVNSATDMTVGLSIDPLAPAGGRILTVVTGSEFAVATNGFTVTSSGASIISVAPQTHLAPGANATLMLTGAGTHWVGPGTTVTFSGGINAGAVTVISNTSLTVNISTGPGAGVYGITTTTGGEVAMLSQAVTVSAAPLISSVAPTTGVQGASLDVIVTGTNTSFTTGGVSANFGSGITVNSVTPNSATSIDINISISYVAPTGGTPVMLIANGTPLSFNFTVTPDAAAVINVTPSSAARQSNVALQVTGWNTHWVQGTTVASLGDANITTSNVIVNSATTAEVDVTIGGQANLGLHPVNMTTGGEQASISAQGPPPGSWTYTNNAKGEHGSILGGMLYAPLENDANYGASGLGVFDPATGMRKQFINIPSNCLEAAPAMDIRGFLHVYSCSSAAGAAGGFLAKIDLNAGTVVNTLVIPTFTQVDWEKVPYDPVNDIVLVLISGVGLRAVHSGDYSTAWTNTDVNTTRGGSACGACETGPVLINGLYGYWQDYSGTLFKISLATGATVAAQAAFASSYVGVYANMSYDEVDQRIFLTTAANTVYAVNAADLSLIWTQTVDNSSWYFFRGGAYNNNVYYVTDRQTSSPYGSKVHALNAANGQVLWTNTTAADAGAEISSLIIDDTFAYCGTYDYTTFNYNYILVINLSDGTIEESIPLVHGVASSIPTAYAGKVIIGLWDTFGYQAVQVRAAGGTGNWYYKADPNMTGYAGAFMSGDLATIVSGFTVLPSTP